MLGAETARAEVTVGVELINRPPCAPSPVVLGFHLGVRLADVALPGRTPRVVMLPGSTAGLHFLRVRPRKGSFPCKVVTGRCWSPVVSLQVEVRGSVSPVSHRHGQA